MYELRCPNCGWTKEMTAEEQAAAVAEAEQLQATHHIEHCPRCQWVIRVAVDSLREAPPAVEAPELLTAPEPPLLLEEKKPAAKKPAARKPAAKKPAVKKPATRKPAAKKPAAKKPAAKKPTAKKPAAKKPPAKKPATRRTTARKPAAKKSTPRSRKK